MDGDIGCSPPGDCEQLCIRMQSVAQTEQRCQSFIFRHARKRLFFKRRRVTFLKGPRQRLKVFLLLFLQKKKALLP
jgi:hypothetical protein